MAGMGTAGPPPPSAAITGLVQRLAKCFVDVHCLPEERRSDYTAELHRYTMRVLSSRFEPAVVADSMHVGELLKKKLGREQRSADAIKLSALLRRLGGLHSLSKEWSVLFLLHRLAGTPSQLASQNHAAAPLSAVGFGRPSGAAMPDPFHSEGLQRIEQTAENTVGRAPGSSRASASGSGAGHSHSVHGSRASTEARSSARTGDRPGFDEYKRVVNTAFEVGEHALVRDMVYVLQGIDGKYVKYSRRADGFIVDAAAGVPRATRHLCHTLSELGWMFLRVQRFVSEGLDNPQTGRVAHALCAVLQEELAEYYRLIAALEAQHATSEPPPGGAKLRGTGESASSGLTLRRLLVWSYEPRHRFKTMAVLVDTAKAGGIKGGALASAIHAHSRHGDPDVRAFVSRVMKRLSVPIFQATRRWILEGELDDPHSEFYIASRRAVPADRLWAEKYQLRDTMLPSFLPKALAHKVLLTGKAINFLRACCHDEQWVREFARQGRASANSGASRLAALLADSAGSEKTVRGAGDHDESGATTPACFEYGEEHLSDLTAVVGEAEAKVSARLKTVLVDNYDFPQHCRALQSFLLLKQGDFIQSLMTLVAEELEKPAQDISKAVLSTKLEQALRASSAIHEAPNVLDRLDIQLLAPSPGDRGWEVFSLLYHLQSPLSTIFTPHAMESYLRLFNFLWRLKRVETALNSTWAQSHILARGRGRSFRAVYTSPRFHGDIQLCNQLRIRMLHFVQNLQYYLSAEVLGTSWTAFLEQVGKAKDLDSVIDAHNTYLNQMLQGALLGSAADASAAVDTDSSVDGTAGSGQGGSQRGRSVVPLLSKLNQLFSVILRFHDAQDALQDRISDTVSRLETRAYERSQAERWGVADGDDYDAIAEDEELLRGGVEDPVLARVVRDYELLFRGFYSELRHHDELSFLYFRLDYNEFYATHSATLLSDNTMMAGGTPGASTDDDGDGYPSGL